MQIGQFARIAQNYAVRVSEFVRNLARDGCAWSSRRYGLLPLMSAAPSELLYISLRNS